MMCLSALGPLKVHFWPIVDTASMLVKTMEETGPSPVRLFQRWNGGIDCPMEEAVVNVTSR